MYLKTTYDQEFDDLMMHLTSKYPKKLFDLDGIGKQMDMSEFSKNFFASNVTADASIDANANCDDVSVIAYNTELPKPYFRMNSYYILWKELKRLYGLEVANNIIEMQLSGDIYIHDFHGVAAGMPYSYHYATPIVIKESKNLPPESVTMKELFLRYEEDKVILPDRESIDLREKGIKIFDGDKFVELKFILRHKIDKKLLGFSTKATGFKVGWTDCPLVVTEDHPIILLDGKEIQAIEVRIGDKLAKSDNDDRLLNTTVCEIKDYTDLYDSKYVYDVTTETGTFNSNGIKCHNCFNYTTYDIMTKGLPMVKKVKSLPPKYLYAFKSQLEQFTVIASNSTLGAML